jgi:predicted DsbA family dithiol-disulfide isomerase
MKVEIWSDIVCPFCYIGKRKFEHALNAFPHKEHIEIEWRSFQLDPEMQPLKGISVHQYLAERKGVSAAQGKAMNDQMTKMASAVGLDYHFDKAIITNTLQAHRLLHFAKNKGKQQETKEKLFAAYYTEGKDIGDLAVLTAIGESVGLVAEEIKESLQGHTFIDEVNADIYMAQQIGVQGVPFFVFNNKYAVSGAQPSDVFTQVLEKVWQEEQPLIEVIPSSGSCTIDGICD